MDNEATVSDLISLAYDQKPVDFQSTFDQLVKDRLADAIADRKLEIAKTVFNGPDDPNDDDDDNSGVEDELDLGDDEEDYDFDDEIFDQEEEQDGEAAE